MNRRELLKFAGTIGIGVGIAGGWMGMQRWRRYATARAFVDEALGGRALEDGVFDRFMEAYAPLYGLPTEPRKRSFVTAFLMSTDLFQQPPDSTQPLRWVALYSPYHTPCHNPLATVNPGTPSTPQPR